MKNKKRLLVLTIILMITLIAIVTIESTDFDLKFSVDQNDSTVEAETVTLKGKLIKLPLDFYYIKGKLYIDEKSYSLGKFKKVSNPYNDDIYTLVFNDKDDQEFMNGEALLVGNISDNTVQSMNISIFKMKLNTGFSYGETINCQIVYR